nr:hypothetical protein RWETBTHO_RWETBTHO_CDS_0003 [Microvirus sp.]
MIFRTQHTGSPVTGEVITSPSVTVQGDCLSLSELLRRLTNNTLQAQDVIFGSQDVFDEKGDFEMPGDIFGATLDEVGQAQQEYNERVIKERENIESKQEQQPEDVPQPEPQPQPQPEE